MIECKQEPDDFEWQQVKQQVLRLAGLKDFPKFEPLAYKELCLAFLQADDVHEVGKVITELVREAEVCPTPAAVYRVFHDRREARKPLPADTWKRDKHPLDHLSRGVTDPLLVEHMAAYKERQAELAANPSLRRTVETPAKARLAVLQAKLRAVIDEKEARERRQRVA